MEELEIEEASDYLEKEFEKKYPEFKKIKLDFEDGPHTYTKDNKLVDLSVTKILGEIQPPFVGGDASKGGVKPLYGMYENYMIPNHTEELVRKQNTADFVIDQAIIHKIDDQNSFLAYLIQHTYVGQEGENDCDQIYAFMVGASFYTFDDKPLEKLNLEHDKIVTHRNILKPKASGYVIWHEYTYYNFDEAPFDSSLYNNVHTSGRITRVQTHLKLEHQGMLYFGVSVDKKNPYYLKLPKKDEFSIFVQLFWKEASYQGSIMHSRIEYYLNQKTMFKEEKLYNEMLSKKKGLSYELTAMLKWIFSYMYRNSQTRFRTELRLYKSKGENNPEYVGTLDFMSVNHKNKTFSMYDWKRSKDLLKKQSKQYYYHSCSASGLGRNNMKLQRVHTMCPGKGFVCTNKYCTDTTKVKSFGKTKLDYYMLQEMLYTFAFNEEFIDNPSGYFQEYQVSDVNIVGVSPISHTVSHYQLMLRPKAFVAGTSESNLIDFETVQDRMEAALYILRNGREKKEPKEQSEKKSTSGRFSLFKR